MIKLIIITNNFTTGFIITSKFVDKSTVCIFRQFWYFYTAYVFVTFNCKIC